RGEIADSPDYFERVPGESATRGESFPPPSQQVRSREEHRRFVYKRHSKFAVHCRRAALNHRRPAGRSQRFAAPPADRETAVARPPCGCNWTPEAAVA